MDKLNQEISEGQVKPAQLMVGSLDVKALYTSIDQKVAGVKVKERILQSKADYEGLDYKGGLIWSTFSIEKVSKKIKILLIKINILN